MAVSSGNLILASDMPASFTLLYGNSIAYNKSSDIGTLPNRSNIMFCYNSANNTNYGWGMAWYDTGNSTWRVNTNLNSTAGSGAVAPTVTIDASNAISVTNNYNSPLFIIFVPTVL